MKTIDWIPSWLKILIRCDKAPANILKVRLLKTWISEHVAQREQQLSLHAACDIGEVLELNALIDTSGQR